MEAGAPPRQGRAPVRAAVTPRQTEPKRLAQDDATRNATEIERVSETIQPRLLGVRDAARYLGVAPATLRDLVASGRLARVRIGLPVTPHRKGGELRRLLVDRADLDALAERSKEGAGTAGVSRG